MLQVCLPLVLFCNGLVLWIKKEDIIISNSNYYFSNAMGYKEHYTITHSMERSANLQSVTLTQGLVGNSIIINRI